MKKFFLLTILIVLVTSCNPATATPPPTEKPIETEVIVITETPVATETPTPTDLPTATLEPTPIPTTITVPQQWNGSYTYTSGSVQKVNLLIEKVDGTTFSGKMIWQSFGSNARGAILRMNGEFVTDFGDELEQARWNNHEDYRNGDRSGTWLKWTETEVIDGGNYTVNGWYYAHIRSDGSMLAVYFFNATEIVADSGTFVFRLATP